MMSNSCAKGAEHALGGLAGEIGKRHPFAHAEEEAFLNVLRTGVMLAGDFALLFRAHDISEPAYNTLRILRAAGAEGRACHEIGEHLVARVPDVTRLVDRLEAAGLVMRERSAADRRVVRVHLTTKGLKVVADLDGPVLDLHKAQLGHLTRGELAELNRLLVKARQGNRAGGA
ncbi:MAG: MarR family transcriptional regulator [Phycisphaerales bacterium]